MNKLLKSIITYTYRNYQAGIWVKVVYFSAVLSFTVLLYLNLLTLLILFNSDLSGVHWWGSEDTPAIKYTKAAIIFIVPTSIIIWLFFRKRMMDKLKNDNRRISRGYFYLLIYFLFSFLLFTIVALIKL